MAFQELHLNSNNGIGIEEARVLSKLLTVPSIRMLSLRGCPVGDRGCEYLATMAGFKESSELYLVVKQHDISHRSRNALAGPLDAYTSIV